METKAHYVLIGVFTLLMLAAGFGLVLFFSGASGSFRRTYEIAFNGPVNGLSKGSSVNFSGLRVGEVTWVDLDPQDPRRVIAYFQIFRNLTLHADTKAQLEAVGLTGGVAIALSGGSPDSPIIKGEVGEAPIQGETSAFSSLLGRLDSISTKADTILTMANKLLADNTEGISDTVKNVDTFSKALSSNSSGLQDALGSISDLAKHAGPLADRLTKLTDDADKIIQGLSAAKLAHIVDDVTTLTDALAASQGDVKALISDSSAVAKRINEATVNLKDTLAQVDSVVKAVDPKKIATLLDGADALGATLRDNRGNLDRTIKNASELSAKLNDSADKLDGLIDSAKSLIGSADVKGPLGLVGDAAKSIRQLADDLDERIKPIAAGLTRFSGSGLREYEALAGDGRRTLNDIDRLIRSIESNPSQLIFGAKKQ